MLLSSNAIFAFLPLAAALLGSGAPDAETAAAAWQRMQSALAGTPEAGDASRQHADRWRDICICGGPFSHQLKPQQQKQQQQRCERDFYGGCVRTR